MRMRSTILALATAFVGLSSAQVAAQASVSLYRDCGYDGGGASLGAGRYDMNDLASLGLRNDDISSMIVDDGFAIVYYEDAGFSGVERLIFGPMEMPCLISDGSNDKISSFIIEVVR